MYFLVQIAPMFYVFKSAIVSWNQISFFFLNIGSTTLIQ